MFRNSGANNPTINTSYLGWGVKVTFCPAVGQKYTIDYQTVGYNYSKGNGRKLLFLLLTKLERMDLNQILGQGEFRTRPRRSSMVFN